MTTKIRIELEQAFKAECKVIDLKHEYTGYRENIRWAIATAFTETALRSKYGEIIAQYEPSCFSQKNTPRSSCNSIVMKENTKSATQNTVMLSAMKMAKWRSTIPN